MVEWRWVGKGGSKKWKLKKKRKMSYVVASYVCSKNMFYIQTSLKGLSTFSAISLALLIASIIPVLLKRLIAISLSSFRVLYRSVIHFTVMKKKLQLPFKLISQNQQSHDG